MSKVKWRSATPTGILRIPRFDAFLAEDHGRSCWAGSADLHTCCDLGHLRDSAGLRTAGSSPRPPDRLGLSLGTAERKKSPRQAHRTRNAMNWSTGRTLANERLQ